VRVSLAKVQRLTWGLHGAYIECDKFADHLFRIVRLKLREMRCGLFDWDETVPAFPKWGSGAWACRAAKQIWSAKQLLGFLRIRDRSEYSPWTEDRGYWQSEKPCGPIGACIMSDLLSRNRRGGRPLPMPAL
jgi:hypothetical protein